MCVRELGCRVHVCLCLCLLRRERESERESERKRERSMWYARDVRNPRRQVKRTSRRHHHGEGETGSNFIVDRVGDDGGGAESAGMHDGLEKLVSSTVVDTTSPARKKTAWD